MAGLAALVWLAGCATPDARIRKNREAFDALPEAAQALIREGKVAVGFTSEMVLLAMGDPDQRWVRTDAAGERRIWSYTTYDQIGGGPLYRGYYHSYHGGYPIYDARLFGTDARPREYLRVEFEGDVVSAIEQGTR